MLKRLISLALATAVVAVLAQAASADPTNAKNSQVITANCGAQQLQVSVNGNGEFTPAHVIGSTAVFVPTAFNVTFSFTPTGGTMQSDTDTSARAGSDAPAYQKQKRSMSITPTPLRRGRSTRA